MHFAGAVEEGCALRHQGIGHGLGILLFGDGHMRGSGGRY